jgi:hypothetical protein
MSVDIEKRFIGSLLHARLSAQENFYAKQIPTKVFRVRPQEATWVYRFREKYGQYPTPADFRAKFHYRLPKVRSPIEATLQPVLDRAMFEQMCQVQDKTKKLLETEDNIGKAFQVFRAGIQSLTDYSTDYEDIDILTDEGADEDYRAIVKSQLEGGGRILDTPWHSLNRVVKYFSFGEQISITSRYGMGKSWFIAHWAHHLAQKGFRVGIFSKEMPGKQFQRRLECIRYRLNYPRYRDGDLSPKQLRRWRRLRRKDKISPPKNYCLKIFSNESEGGLSFPQIVSKTKQYDLEIVFFDGAYLNRPPELRADIPDTQRFTYLSNRSKEYAKALNVLWINTLQDNRSAEDKKGNTKGGATTVYGSDAWGQDSDYLLQMDGRRGAKERGVALNKGRESDLVEFRIGFQLRPCPKFDDMGPKPQAAVAQLKLKKKNVFRGVK